LDDVSVLTQVAAKKTAGVLGDDLALNAQQVSGVNADRELPVIWAVAKGSALNKLILVPAALSISAFAPWLVIPLLMAGGLFLCYEGVEKLSHHFLNTEQQNAKPTTMPEINKIKGAIRTDFVLSAEIIVITLGTVAGVAFSQQIMVLIGIAVVMTIGVYGLVAAIVKLDDGGLYLAKTLGKSFWSSLRRKLGFAILSFAPYIMKALSVIGTVAMFLVGGGILTHGIPVVYDWIKLISQSFNNAMLEFAIPALLNAGFGILAGAVALIAITLLRRLNLSIKNV
jgi:predicted DNA repair protein MutK